MYHKIKRQAARKNKYLIGVFIILVLSDSLQSKSMLQNNIITVNNTECTGFYVLVYFLRQLYI